MTAGDQKPIECNNRSPFDILHNAECKEAEEKEGLM